MHSAGSVRSDSGSSGPACTLLGRGVTAECASWYCFASGLSEDSTLQSSGILITCRRHPRWRRQPHFSAVRAKQPLNSQGERDRAADAAPGTGHGSSPAGEPLNLGCSHRCPSFIASAQRCHGWAVMVQESLRSAAIVTRRRVQVFPERLCQRWKVPLCVRKSPALMVISCSLPSSPG